MINAILTGSRVYGIPTEDSDLDLVVLMGTEDSQTLGKIMGVVGGNLSGDPCYPTIQFKVGGLNVIVENEQDRFDVWVRGTQLLAEQAPVTRQTAVDLFKSLRAAQQAKEVRTP